MRNILIYGGSFNPPHRGHERLLRAAVAEVKPALTLVIPSGVSPHKDVAKVPFADRANMCRVFLECGDNVVVSGLENTGTRRRSYTYKTVRRIQKKYPGSDLFLLIGSDMLLSFESWHRYRRLLCAVTLVCASRCGADSPRLDAAKERIEKLGGSVRLLELEPVTLSSSDVRKQMRAGGNIDQLVSPYVEQYARKRNLYR